MVFQKVNPFTQFPRIRHEPALHLPSPMTALPLYTLSQGSNKTVSAGINEQVGCPLYTNLPAEIREQIFSNIVSGDGNVVHIFQRYPKMSYWRCTECNQPCTWDNPCSKTLPRYGQWMDKEQNRVKTFNSDWGVLALMRTCKRLRNDIAPRLYKDTHFHFPTFREVKSFCSELRKLDRNSIRYLSLDYDRLPQFHAYDRNQSIYSWAEIRKMLGLEELRMVQKDINLDLRAGNAYAWRAGLAALQALKVVEFVVPAEDLGKWKEFLGKSSRVIIKGQQYEAMEASAD